MKSINLKDQNFSLHNNENYRQNFNVDISAITKKYSDLTIEYFKYIVENINLSKKCFSKFIIIRGLDTITNVFLHILHSTKNIDLTYFHCQKSFYFYVEFIGQITDDEKTFLQLTSRDATTYVYKKTIFDINVELKNLNKNESDEFKEKMEFIRSYININQMYLLKLIKTENYETLMLQHMCKIMAQIINIVNKDTIIKIENIIDKLYNLIRNSSIFFEVNYVLIKKLVKNKDLIEKVQKNINSENFHEKIIENNDKIVAWIVS